ncbi:phage/plasmid primase, P4 family [Roseburia hominis]
MEETTNNASAPNTGQTSPTSFCESRDSLIEQITKEYLATIDPQNPPSPTKLKEDLLGRIRTEINIVNSIKAKGEKFRYLKELCPAQIAAILLHLYCIARVVTASDDSGYDILALYQTEGENKGTYVSDPAALRRLARQYSYMLDSRGCKEVETILWDTAPRVPRCTEPNLIALNNGIFDYDAKVLHPFTTDKVFLTKSKVNYNILARNIIIHNDEDGTDWDVESWMCSLSDDPEIIRLLWEILGAIIRPNVPWNKSAWFYSTQGNNGKGTLCELMRQLCGKGSYTSISLSDMGKDFMLEPLIHSSAIIVDENNVGTFIDKAANLKAIITGDVLQINRKFKTPISYQFRGFMVQCLNEMPRIKDKSDSFFRRQLFILFEKCFTGRERKYIKEDYLHRPEVLEYVLYKVLNTNYYTLSEPKACKLALEEYREFNDPIRQFIGDILSECVWDLLPFSFVYDLYKAYFKRWNPSGTVQGKSSFLNELLSILAKDPDSEWYCDDKQKKIRTGSKMDKPELFIREYGLVEWVNPHYSSSYDNDKYCRPCLKESYRGLLRKGIS